MKSNKKVKEKLIKLYGNECFIEKLHLRKDTEPRKYKSKGQMKRMKQLTFHHIKERRKGGKATLENGALISAENHSWFHKQPKEKQRMMNDMFQKYKELKVEFVDDLELPFEIKFTEFKIDERGKYDRAKKKEEDRKLVEDYLGSER